MTELLCWLARIVPRQGKAVVLREVLRSIIGPSRAEPGCLGYTLHETGKGDAIAFCLYEVWRDGGCHAAHMATLHLRAFAARLDELVEGEIVIEPMRLVEPYSPGSARQ